MRSSHESRAERFERERRRRKIVALVLLLLLLLALGYSAYYFSANRRLPIADVLPDALAEVQPPRYLFSITGQGGSRLDDVVGLAYRGTRVYVVNFATRTVRVFDRDGRYLFEFNAVDGGVLKNPVHLATDSKGQVWVTDRRLRSLFVFDADGHYLRKFSPGAAIEASWTPLAVAFDEKGRLLVTDVGVTTEHRVHVFDQAGKHVVTFGKTGQVAYDQDDPGSFYFPNGIAGYRDLVYVADGDNRRIQVFDLAGRFQRFVATSGVPRGVAMDDTGRLYVADALAHQIDVYTSEGDKVVRFGEQGVGTGQFSFPNDVALDGTGRIYITDRENDQVQVWAWPVAEAPVELARKYPWAAAAACCLPPLFLLVPLLRRRRKYVVTHDFVEALVADGQVREMDGTGLEWLVPVAEHPQYVDRVEDGVDLGELLVAEEHSPSDAADLQARLEVDGRTAVLLAIARRVKRLATTDEELRKSAVLLGIDVYGPEEFLRRHGRRR
ncbi:MAG: hypothetical protein FDZ70_01375 [Actinobacteria bacterium]|nr:MAG: hypothetical protein FDZ70_01375 [Actinomycetota bacterium]